MGQPLISIIVPTYNRPQTVLPALQSVLTQDFSDFEVVVADDSTDELTQDGVKNLNSSKIRYIRTERIGLAEKLNFLLEVSQGDWAVILGDDDLFEPGYLPAMASIIQAHPDAALVKTRYRFMDNEGAFIKEGVREPDYLDPPDFLNVIFLPWYQRMVNITGFLFPRKKLIELGGFLQTRFAWNADTDAWARLGLEGRVYFENRPLINLRINTNSEYKKMDTDYSVYFQTKGLFYDSMIRLFDKAFSRFGRSGLKKIQNAKRLFLKYWMVEECRIRFEDALSAGIAQNSREADQEIRLLAQAMRTSGMPVRVPLFIFYDGVTRLPAAVRAVILPAFFGARLVWRHFSPPKHWGFLKKG